MRRAGSAILVLAGCAACFGSDDGGGAAAPVPPTVIAPPTGIDAAPGITQLPTFDPNAGLHLDEAGDPELPPLRTGSSLTRSRRTVEILLRSSPPGALALVDGEQIGKTPTYWEGEFTGREREFTFVLPGYALARYRFVPIANGIVHAKLDAVLGSGPLPFPPIPEKEKPRRPAGSRPSAPPPPPPTDAAPAPQATPDAAAAPAPAPDAAAVTRPRGPAPN
jgi:hypothetical protein